MLPVSLIEDFKQIYLKEYGQEAYDKCTDEDFYEMAQSLVRLFQVVYD